MSRYSDADLAGENVALLISRSQLLKRFPYLEWLAPLYFVLLGLLLQFFCSELSGGRTFLFLYPALALGVLFGSRASNILASLVATVGAIVISSPLPLTLETYFSFGTFIASALILSFVSEAIVRVDLSLEQRAHRKVDTLLNTLPIFAGVQSLDGKIVMCNELAARAVEHDPKELIGRYFWESPWWDLQPQMRERLKEALAQARAGIPQQFETPYTYRVGGEPREGWVYFSMVPVRDERGAVESITTTGFDITERKQAEDRLRRSHEEATLEKQKFEGLFAHSPAIMALVRGPELVFEKTNAVYQELIGHRQVLGKKLLDALPELRGTTTQESLLKVFTNGEPLHFRESRQLIQRTPGGPLEEVFLDFTYQRILNADGSPYGVLGTAVDVSDQVRARQLLRNQKDWLQMVLDRIEAGVIFIDPKSNDITFANKAALKMTAGTLQNSWPDYSPDAAVYDEKGQALPLDRWPRMRAAMGETIDGEIFSWKTAEGTHYYLIYASQIASSHGHEPTALISMLDLTELKRAERTITRLTSSNVIGILNWRLEGEIIDANDAFLHMMGYTREDLEEGRINWRAMTPSTWKHADLQALTEMLATGSHRPYEKEYFHKDGHSVPIIVGSALFEDSANSGVSFILDISEQRRIQEELAGSESRFRKIAESLPQLVWTANAAGEVDYYNHRIELYKGAHRDQLRWDWQPLIYPDDAAMTVKSWKEAVEQRQEYQCEHRLLMQDGTFRWHLSRGLPLLDNQGRLERWFGTATDIHDQISTQADLKAARDEAERANRLKSAFLANMSHEIRTPLGAILGFADLLRDTSLSFEERSNYLGIISNNGEQLSTIINDILDLSKIEAGHMTFEYLIARPAELARDVVSLLSVKAKEKGLALDFDCDPTTPPSFTTDPLRLKQILTNVVGNAIKFTATGSVRLRSYGQTQEQGPPLLCFEVIDTGIGIAEDAREKIFSAFVQADGSLSRRFGGTGLGLALSRQLARQLGGDLELLHSEVQHGSTFRLKLLDQPSAAEPPTSPVFDVRPEQEIAPNVLANLKILVVDDALDNRRLIRHLLMKLGAEVDLAENGLQGFRKALTEDFDLVLMDIQMPELDGYMATQKLREAGYQKPIIALTAHAMSEVRRKCLNVGYTDHLTKPINRRELVESVARHVGRGPKGQVPSSHFQMV